MGALTRMGIVDWCRQGTRTAKNVMTTNIDQVDWRSLCPISSALDVLGDRWSLLIIRDLLIHGTRTYSEFLGASEHISTNILAARLEILTCLKLIERTDPEGSRRNNAFQLTESGIALRPVLEGLGRWAQTHLAAFHADILSLP